MTDELSKCSQNHEVTLCVDFKKPVSFVGASVEDQQPVTKPLKTLEDLLGWRPNDTTDHGQVFSVSNVPRAKKQIDSTSTKTVVCHDMMDNYGPDRFVQGAPGQDHYILPYWSGIDIFVYFGHHLVTIPPVTWVNAAHRNGVAVLGTFITEWDKGAKLCRAILNGVYMWSFVADQLVEICKFYQFDGWLVNIENQIEEEQMDCLVKFVSYLTEEMHKEVPGSQVLWFDSVIKNGQLKWQNEINSENKYIVKCVDGVIVNYTWREEHLARMEKQVTSKKNVYVGIDVFGRGCYGGGGFNTIAALDLILKHGFSACIYAPGWTYENLDRSKGVGFSVNNKKFWSLLAAKLESHPIEFEKGFRTAFYDGINTIYSKVFGRENKLPIHLDLASQQLQPILQDNQLCRSQAKVDTLDVVVPVEKHGVTIALPYADKCKVHVGEEVLNLNHNISKDYCLKSSGQHGARVFQLSRSDELPFTITGFSFHGSSSPSYILVHPRQSSEDQPIERSFNVHVSDVDWHKCDEGEISLSCTLSFPADPHCGPTEVWYHDKKIYSQIQNKKTTVYQHELPNYLGTSHGSLYRVGNLKVPDPQHEGPDCGVVFYMFQNNLDCIRELKATLTVNYAENLS